MRKNPKNETEIIIIEDVNKINLPKTVKNSIHTSSCLRFILQLRLFTFILITLVFIKVVQILEIVKATNYCN